MPSDQQQSNVAETSKDDEAVVAFLEALADRHSRTIIMCATDSAKTVEELSARGRIPLSTCYRRVRALQRSGLLVVESMTLSGEGKKYSRYRSAFANVSFHLTKDRVSIEAVVNPLLAQKGDRGFPAPGPLAIRAEP